MEVVASVVVVVETDGAVASVKIVDFDEKCRDY